jgi:hypothetical protein
MLRFFTSIWDRFGSVRVNVPVLIWIVAVLQTGRLVDGTVSAEVNVTFAGSVTPGRFPPLPIWLVWTWNDVQLVDASPVTQYCTRILSVTEPPLETVYS